MEPLPASYYGKIDKKNPVIASFKSETKEFMVYMKRVTNSPNFDHQSYGRGSKKLFEIWSKYKPRLPDYYYEEHVLQIADFLSGIKLYKLALWQGYDRFLSQHSPISTEDIKGADHFKNTFFPEGFETDRAKLVFRALQGRCLCTFQLEREREDQSSQERVQRLLHVLGFVRIMMQAVLPHESLCWVLYNGSLYIYNICRYLMTMNCSAQVLEYLLWASVCLETCVPLLNVRFLSWRATLYCAVCQCYYDCQAGMQAEVFARRALGKVNELAKLQDMSCSSASTETRRAFKEAGVKLAAMLFKRSVYEPRRKPKGIFRPKQKSVLKEVQNMPWPRTPTERVLMELFEGHAAQFLALIEALWDVSRRPLQTGTPEEPEMLEVVLELLSAGLSILAGIGGSSERVKPDRNLSMALSGIHFTSGLFELAMAGENKVSVEAAVKLVKLLFRYEQWDAFCTHSGLLLAVLQDLEERSHKKAELELTLLRAAEPLLSGKRSQHPHPSCSDGAAERDKPSGVASMSDDLMALVNTLHKCVCGSAQDIQPDRDLVKDTALFLWAKCKAVFQRVQTGHSDRYRGKLENHSKWVQALYLLSEVSHSCDLALSDPLAVAEMSMRLVAILESNADSALRSGDTSEDSRQGPSLADQRPDTPALSKMSAVEQLKTVHSVVERAVASLSQGRARSCPSDGTAVFDTVYLQESESATGRSTTILFPIDLHLELMAIQHRVSLKLLNVSSAELRTVSQTVDRRSKTSEAVSDKAKTESVLLEKVGKNEVSKAIFLVQKALLSHRKDQSSPDTKKLLEEAVSLTEKAGLEEKRLLSVRSPSERRQASEDKVPALPPPILLSRTHQSMTFKPAPHALGKQVCWYRLYGRLATGINLKVRLGDCHLPGTAEEVPAAGECVLRAKGLQPNEKYVFAVAAYDAQGNLVGNGIGESTRPLLASFPLPLLTTWTHLAQAAYKTGHNALVKRACSELWSHFLRAPSPNQGGQPESEGGSNLEGLAQTGLRLEALRHASPLLLQHFLTSIFIQTDVHIQEKALYCDTLSDGGPLIWGQMARLAECERMLVAIDLALWLNDSSAALQAVVVCYGLLSPLIYHRVPSEAIVQVLVKCLAVLTEIPGALRQKRAASTSESLLHMSACITYHVAKMLRASKEHRMASAVLELGKRLLQEATGNGAPESQSKAVPAEQDTAQGEKTQRKTPCSLLEEESNKLLKALAASGEKNKRTGTFQNVAGGTCELTGQEDPILLYTVVNSSPLKAAFRDVMKFKRTSAFLELAVHLVNRGMQEDQLDLVLQWGQDILTWLKRRDEGLTRVKKTTMAESGGQSRAEKEFGKYTSSVIEYKKPKVSSFRTDKKRKDFLQRKLLSALKGTERDCRAVDTLLNLLPPLLRRHQYRRVCSEDGPWRSRLNLCLAQVHLGLLQQTLEQRSGPALQHSYSHLDPGLFSLAHCGTLVKWRNAPQHIRAPELPSTPRQTVPLTRLRAQPHKANEAGSVEDSSSTEGEVDSVQDTPRTQRTDDSENSEESSVSHKPARHSLPLLLDSLSKAALHLRRAMVLAHRGRHWTSLQWACQVLWDQAAVVTQLVERRPSQEEPIPLSLDQLYSVLVPLLVLASDFLMDMMQDLQLWKAFEVEEKELEASLHFSAPMDDGTLVDLRWLRSLTLRTLELLYLQGKWETLAYLALLFNAVTRERYTHVVTPLLVHAQRRLLERVRHFRGPPVPQPHFTRTEMSTGEKITSRNYAGKQLLSGWSPRQEGNTQPESHNTEARRALALVCVPLDPEETLGAFREALGRGCYALQTFQHSRTLLWLLLAGTQLGFEVPFSKGAGRQSQGRVEFSMACSWAPAIVPPDLSSEDFTALGSIYGCPLPPSQLQTVISSFSSSIKYLQENNQNSLRVQALHDLGNLYLYKGNRRAAQSNWSEALDCALQCSGVLASWDGVTWGGAPQDVLRQAGVWGCLQGATLTAKIAQYLLTSDISQRTACCLLSARLFKTLLGASLPHPQSDWQYASYEMGPELIPGLDLFSESDRAHVGTTAASLSFLCHWLRGTGHLLTVLPLLSLYLYCTGTVCRDSDRAVEGRILKVQVLTELGLLKEAVREVSCLVRGVNIPLRRGSCVAVDRQLEVVDFDASKPLLEPSNLQALEDLVHRHLSPELSQLYGPRLSWRLTMARAQLILALCSSAHCLPDPEPPAQDNPEPQAPCSTMGRRSSISGPPLSPCSDRDASQSSYPTKKAREPGGLQLDPQRLTLAKLKSLLLREAFLILTPQLYSIQSLGGDAEELEMAVETRLLLSAVTLQQGKAASSADQALSAIRLLQDSPLLQDRSPVPVHRPLSSVLRLSRAENEVAEPDAGPQPIGEAPVAAVEAQERAWPLWLRCRLAAVRALVEHIPGTAIHPGVDSSVGAARLLKEGLQEAQAWGDPDTRALLLLQGALLDARKGKPREDSASLLQEAVSLLSGRGCLSSVSALTRATATLQLSDLRGTASQSLHLLTQKMLQQQLSALGESVVLGEGGRVILPPSPGLKNIYLPQLPLLAKVTMRLGCCLAQRAACPPGTDASLWLSSLRALDTALQVSRASATRDEELETDILYCKGVVERWLVSLGECCPKVVTDTFLQAISITQAHCHNLQLVRRCYLEMALMYLQLWEQCSPCIQDQQSPAPPSRPKENKQKTPGVRRVQSPQNRTLSPGELHLLLYWVCLRAASQVSGASSNLTQLCGVLGAKQGFLLPSALSVLPEFVCNDLLNPCGGTDEPFRSLPSVSPESDFGATDPKLAQLTWVHLGRYHAHILNLQRIATHPVGPECMRDLFSLAVDNSLAQRLAQLHSVFSALLPSYKEQCCAPEVPTALLQATIGQPGPALAERGVGVEPLVEVFPWAGPEKEQLCMQWFQPALDRSHQDQDMILLVYAFNGLPISAQRTAASALSELQCGRRWVSLDRLTGIHAQLCAVCAGANVLPFPPAGTPGPLSPKLEKLRKARTSEKESSPDPGLQVLQEKARQCCDQIRALLRPNSDPAVITEIPLEILGDLERCFDPRGGAVVSGRWAVTWLTTLLL